MNSGEGDEDEQPRLTTSPKRHKSRLIYALSEQFFIKDNLFSQGLGILLILAAVWTVLYFILHQEVVPSGNVFSILLLVLSAYVVGTALSYIGLPPLLGMMITGLVFKTFGIYKISGVFPKVVILLRDVALSVILIRAGLGLDAAALRRMKLTVIKLAFCPCIIEAVVAALLAHFLLDLPWLWSQILGFVLSPISPAVVVPCLLQLQKDGYGEDKGISTLVIAASSIDDIIAISAFGLLLGMIFTTQSSLGMLLLEGPLEVALGVGGGLIWGFLLATFPHRNDRLLVGKRVVLLVGGGVGAVLGAKELGFPGAGPLAAITAAFVAASGWKVQGWDPKTNPVSQSLSSCWCVMQPVLFGLIGSEIDVTALDPSNVGISLGIIFVSLTVRIIACSFSVFSGGFTWKEILFIDLAWIPKATVQAALSPQPLDMVRSRDPLDEDQLRYATALLTTAVIAILVTAPLGAAAITLSGPRLLNRKLDEGAPKTEEEEAMRP